MMQALYRGTVGRTSGFGAVPTSAQRAAQRDVDTARAQARMAKTARARTIAARKLSVAMSKKRLADRAAALVHRARTAAAHHAAPTHAPAHAAAPVTARPPTTAAETVTARDVETELTRRGYRSLEPTVEPVKEARPPRITKNQAITIAVDASIDHFSTKIYVDRYGEIARSRSHPYRCPPATRTAGKQAICNIAPGLFEMIVRYGVSLANYYLRGGDLPSWGAPMLRGIALGYAVELSGGLGDWVRDNPYVLTVIGQGMAAYGEHLTAKNVEQVVKDNIPSGMATKADLAELLAQLRQGGMITPGTEGQVSEGFAKASVTMPTWAIPALLIGGVVGAVLFLKR